MAFQEIERKFLVAGDFRKEASGASRIIQGFLSSAPGRTVRVRIRGEQGFLTVKGPAQGLTRFEWEKEIPAAEAEQLLALCEPGVIDKTRWLVPAADGHVWEVDEFHGEGAVRAARLGGCGGHGRPPLLQLHADQMPVQRLEIN